MAKRVCDSLDLASGITDSPLPDQTRQSSDTVGDDLVTPRSGEQHLDPVFRRDWENLWSDDGPDWVKRYTGCQQAVVEVPKDPALVEINDARPEYRIIHRRFDVLVIVAGRSRG
jgi:hypothetical protein